MARWSAGNPAVRHGLILVLVALIFRLAAASELGGSPYFEVNFLPGMDMRGFIDWGLRLADGNWLGMGDGAYWQAPLYPYLLGVHFAIFGEHWLGLVLVQILLGVATVLLTWRVGTRLGGSRVGIIAGLLVALYPPLLFFESIFLGTTLEVAVGTLALFCLVRAAEGTDPRRWALAGAALGLACLARPNFLLVAAVAWLPAWLNNRQVGRCSFKALSAYGGALGVCILPVTLRNLLVGGQFVLISASGPETFRIGNSYDSVALGFLYPQEPLMPLTSLAFWKHLGTKAALFWWGFEPAQNVGVNVYLAQKFSPILAWIPLGFFVLVPLAVVGVYVTSDRWKGLMPSGLFIGGYYLSVILFFVIARFRLPLIPALAVLSAAALSVGWDLWRRHKFRPLAIAGGVVITFGLVLYPFGVSRIRINDYHALVTILMGQQKTEEALAVLEEAAVAFPSTPGIWEEMGRLQFQAGRYETAASSLETELAINPKSGAAHFFLGQFYVVQDPARAAEHLRQYLVLQPEAPDRETVESLLRQIELGGSPPAAVGRDEGNPLDTGKSPAVRVGETAKRP
ncbi:MAG: tetratricopeptide repeat protein [Candidatus Methylomirabilales bacterium]